MVLIPLKVISQLKRTYTEVKASPNLAFQILKALVILQVQGFYYETQKLYLAVCLSAVNQQKNSGGFPEKSRSVLLSGFHILISVAHTAAVLLFVQETHYNSSFKSQKTPQLNQIIFFSFISFLHMLNFLVYIKNEEVTDLMRNRSLFFPIFN